MNSLNDSSKNSFALRAVVGLAAAGLVLTFMHFMSGLINSLFIAYIIAIITIPLLLWLRRKGVPGWLAFLLTLLVVAICALALIVFFLYAAAELTESLPSYIDDIEELQETVNELIYDAGLIPSNFTGLLEYIEGQRAIQIVLALLGSMFEALSYVFLVILFVVFMLVQVFSTPRVLRREIAAGNSYVQRFLKYNLDLRQYMLITTLIAIVTGTLDTIWFVILGIPNPLIWGVVAAILSFVPSIGFWLAAIPPTLLALLEYGPLTALITLVGILLINGIADNVIKPRYIGDGVDLAPFMVIFSVVFWALILGPVGAILGVPMTMLVKSLLFEPDERLSWTARVMGSGKPEAETEQLAQDSAAAEDPLPHQINDANRQVD